MSDKIRTLACLLVPMTLMLFFMACEQQPEEVASEPYIAPCIEVVEVVEVQPRQYYDVPLSFELQDYLRECCEARGIPIALALATIEVESDFRSDIVSSTDDYGLMQINICNHDYLKEELGITDFLAPMDNINAGTYWLSRYYPRYGIEQTAMCYNLGEGGAKKLFKKGVYSTDYSKKILKAYERYEDVINSIY